MCVGVVNSLVSNLSHLTFLGQEVARNLTDDFGLNFSGLCLGRMSHLAYRLCSTDSVELTNHFYWFARWTILGLYGNLVCSNPGKEPEELFKLYAINLEFQNRSI